jgi:hypothetical protein
MPKTSSQLSIRNVLLDIFSCHDLVRYTKVFIHFVSERLGNKADRRSDLSPMYPVCTSDLA